MPETFRPIADKVLIRFLDPEMAGSIHIANPEQSAKLAQHARRALVLAVGPGKVDEGVDTGGADIDRRPGRFIPTTVKVGQTVLVEPRAWGHVTRFGHVIEESEILGVAK